MQIICIFAYWQKRHIGTYVYTIFILLVVTEALVWSASGDTRLNVSKGVMYYIDGNIRNNYSIHSFTGYGIERLAYDFENKTIYFYSATDYGMFEVNARIHELDRCAFIIPFEKRVVYMAGQH